MEIETSLSPTTQARNLETDTPPNSVDERLKEQEVFSHSTNRKLRIAYAVIAVCFAIASIVFWMRFVQFYYDPQKHSDMFFSTLTGACTINILAAFISIIKGLFPPSK